MWGWWENIVKHHQPLYKIKYGCKWKLPECCSYEFASCVVLFPSQLMVRMSSRLIMSYQEHWGHVGKVRRTCRGFSCVAQWCSLWKGLCIPKLILTLVPTGVYEYILFRRIQKCLKILIVCRCMTRGMDSYAKSTGMSLTKLMFFLCLDTARFYAVRNERSTLWYMVLKMA